MTADRPAKRILLAENNPITVSIIKEAAARSDDACEIVDVGNGAEALDYLFARGEFAGAQRPDALLLDLAMPKVGGLQVLREIRATPDLAELPVVVLTSSTDTEAERASYDAGADTFMIKPVGFEEYVELVRGLAQVLTLSEGAGGRPRTEMLRRPTRWKAEQPSPDRPPPMTAEPRPPATEPPATPISAEAAGNRILVVDDDPASVFLIERLLETAGEFVVDSAGNRSAAREKLAAARPDCVILDHYLPGTNSLELMSEFAVVAPNLPVILLTSSTDPRLARSAIEYGATHVLHKGNLMGQDLAEVIAESIASRSRAKAGPAAPPPQAPGGNAISGVTEEGDAVITTDRRGTIVYVNGRAEELLGTSQKALLGQPVFDATGPFGGKIEMVEEGQRSSRRLVDLKAAEGGRQTVPVKVVPLRPGEREYDRSVALIFEPPVAR